jgi:methylenetetrahydrofolate reductase (NADPH)
VVAGEPAPELAVSEAVKAGPVPLQSDPNNPFAAACSSDRFVTNVEISPPDSVDPQPLLDRAGHFRDIVDAVNITDGAGGNCHLSSIAASLLLARAGFSPVRQFSCRDWNRIALQGDLLGAASLGIRNVLCLTGDDVSRGEVRDVPILEAGHVEVGNVVRLMAVIVRDTHQPCRETFIDQEFHDFAGGSVVRTMRFGVISERLDWRGRPRNG